MRNIEPQPGTKRIRTWFAFLPVYVGREMRWLETVTVEQEYWELGGFDAGWRNNKFL